MDLKSYYNSVAKLNVWANAYYCLDNPKATDEEYDNLYKEVKEYERLHPEDIVSNSPTQRVGDYIQTKFEKYTREHKMYSLDDVFNLEELTKWLINVNKKIPEKYQGFCCSPKFDGCSLEVIYDKLDFNNSKFSLAATRGNGYEGENVTLNAKTINTIPLTILLPPMGIRGEVVIRKEVFNKLNTDNTFSNPRNLASGSLRQLNPNVTKSRNLDFIPWGVTNIEYVAKALHTDDFWYLMDFIYKVGNFINYKHYFKYCKTIEDVITYVEDLKSNRDKYPITLDGCVITVNHIPQQLLLGYNNKTPKFSIAYKLPPVEKVTKLIKIEEQIGRTGVITPVGILEPVNIDGKTISKVTLHNYSEILNKDLRIGDNVIVILSGDVIPKIIKVLTDRRKGDEIKIEIPTKCSICNSDKLQVEDKFIKCCNYYCKGQIIERINHFLGKNGLDVKGISSNVIETLVTKYEIKDPLDFYYRITEKDMINTLGEKLGKKLYEKLEISKTCTITKFISALGIPNIGLSAAKIIAGKIGLDWNKKQEEIETLCPTLNKNTISSILNFDMVKCLECYTSAGFEIIHK